MIDLETTGVSAANDRICQVGLIKIYPDGTEKSWMTLINPMMPIPQVIQELINISDEDVQLAPRFETVAGVLHKGIEGCYIGGYNVHFDMEFLDYEFFRAQYPFDPDDFILLDAFSIFKHYHPRNLTAAVKLYLGKALDAAHQADIDIRATKEVLEAQFVTHEDLPRTVEEVYALVTKPRDSNKIDKQGKLKWNADGHPVMGFGKHVNTLLHNVPKKYLQWMIDGDFSPKVKRIISAALQGRYPEKDNG